MWQPIVTRDRARALRRDMSLPEVLLWRELRRAASPAAKFRRQHPHGPYVLDFYCAAARFCIEVDGEQHLDEAQQARDESRDAYLRDHGVHTLRVSAFRVLDSPSGTAERLIAWAKFLTAQREARSSPTGGGSGGAVTPRSRARRGSSGRRASRRRSRRGR